MDGCWFNLPDGQTATSLEVTVPVHGRVPVTADSVADMDEWRRMMIKSMEGNGFIHHGRLTDMLAGVISNYEQIARDALSGAEWVRNDMLVFLRAAVIVAESIIGDHLNHGQKNERIRGLVGVLEKSIESLRAEQFDFRGRSWRRGHDLFRWNENERKLRERIQELESQLKVPDKEDGSPF